MTRPTTFGYRDEHRPSFVAALLFTLILLGLSTGCLSASAQRKLLDSVNDAQDAAARTYDEAKTKQSVAQQACAASLRAAGQPLPASPAEIRPKCAGVGSPVPYDPQWLQHAAGPVNALYDGVRAANAQRVSADGDAPAAVLGNLIGLFEAVVADLAQAGIAVPKTVTDTIATLKSATAGGK